MGVKNIIVCADGTGNKGGYSPDSNVYKIYNAVDKNFSSKPADGVGVSEQIIFYDNGVGTAKNKYLRALGGAFGFGFEDNVRDLYKYIARNYEPGESDNSDKPGDRIYFFGFSRGASTVRACNGMINKCGLVDGRELRNRELKDLVDQAFAAYVCHKENPDVAERFKKSAQSHGAVPIHFLGVWDTVVALGFPKRTDVTGPVTRVLNKLFLAFEDLLDIAWPHNFYHYKLTDNVEFACQALSIDDERTAFWPFVWSEKDIEGAADRTKDNVEQVWFAGMHSNVGGGYERAGMAGVPLHWMINRAEKHGLVFDKNSIQGINSACHIHGRMYNSRDGVGFMYRYHPREIKKLCEDKLLGEIKIHCSVIERMSHRTANYAPGHIPAEFEMVDSAVPAKITPMNPGADKDWAETRGLIDDTVSYRKSLYGVLLASIMVVIAVAIKLNSGSPLAETENCVTGKIAGFLQTVLPDFFTGLINAAVINNPFYLVIALVYVLIYLVVRRKLHERTVDFSETFRRYIIGCVEKMFSCKKQVSKKE